MGGNPQLRRSRMHILGQITCKDQSSASSGMKEREIAGVKGLAVETLERRPRPLSIRGPDSGQAPAAPAVVRIPEHGVTQMLPMGADLVGTAGFEPEIHGRPRIPRP